MQCTEVIKVSELSKTVKNKEYVDKVRMAYERIEHQEIESVEEDWEEFGDAVMECATVVHSCRRVGQGTRKGSKWWNNKVIEDGSIIVEEGFRAVAAAQGTERAFDEYREERKRVKTVVREAKREAEDRFVTKISQNF